MIPSPNFSLLFIIACFWLVYLVVSRWLVKPLGGMLDERRRSAVQASEGLGAAQDRLKQSLARCERELATAGAEASKQRQALRTEGESLRAARVGAARQQSQDTLAALGSELDAAVATARAGIRSQAAVLARELASRLAGREVAA